jgi:septum formation protein
MSRIILASKSAARRTMLTRAGVPFDIAPADIDEEAIKKNFDASTPVHLADYLAFSKARAVSLEHFEDTVIGSDSLLVCEGEIFSKADSRDDARDKLKCLRGRTHSIISAVNVCRGGAEVWSDAQESFLTMRDFDDAFLEDYLDTAGDVLTGCVGAYAVEERGIRLFENIEGDYFTILGMPLLPLLNFLREDGVIA